MDLQVPSLAVLSAENATLNDQLQWLYDFPFAALIRRPIFQTALNDILKSLTPNQLLEYMDDRPYNPAMTDRIVKEMFRRFSLDTLELISRSFHVDHPFAKAMDFAIHKERMSGMITVLNRWSIRLFPPPSLVLSGWFVWIVNNVTLVLSTDYSAPRKYLGCYWCDGYLTVGCKMLFKPLHEGSIILDPYWD